MEGIGRFYKWLVLIPILLVGLPVVLAGCSRGAGAPAPPEIRYGEDLCANCRMIISDPRFAAGYAREVGEQQFESLAFDDIGDMIQFASGQASTDTIMAWYVHDYESEAWLDATTAYFVVSPQIPSPMGHGIAAHESRSAAEAMAAEVGGEVFDWQTLQGQALAPHLHTHLHTHHH